MSRFKYYHIVLDVHDQESALSKCEAFYSQPGCRSLFYVNAHCFNLAWKNLEYQTALKQADLVLNDGIGISIGAKWAGIRLKANMNGTDFSPEMLKQAIHLGKKVFLLGGSEGVAEIAAQKISGQIAGIQIVGYHSGFFDFNHCEELIEEINQSGAELILVGMGVPRQELWISRYKHQFTHIKIAAAVGAYLDFAAGKVTRAPLWVRKIYLEWLFRLAQEPVRLFRRYVIGNIRFFLILLRAKN